jgi:hypothetical protein
MITATFQPGVYVYLFHGRRSIEEDMDDWGESGPTFGPFPYFHVTYAFECKCDDDVIFNVVKDCIYYDGMYYGDWSVVSHTSLEPSRVISVYEKEKANVDQIVYRA